MTCMCVLYNRAVRVNNANQICHVIDNAQKVLVCNIIQRIQKKRKLELSLLLQTY